MKRLVPSSLYGDHVAQLHHFTVEAGPDDCWKFEGFVLPSGYGQLGRNLLAHRVAWEAANGRPVPAGMVVDHTCHNRDPECNASDACRHRRCVNPAHLEAVSSPVNILRGKGFASVNAAKTRCVKGHEFTPDNTYFRPDRFGRICRTCRDAKLRALRPYYAEQRRLARTRAG